MNYIHRLAAERDAARATIKTARAGLEELLVYLSSAKFASPDGDYIHVRTDLVPRLMRLRSTLLDD